MLATNRYPLWKLLEDDPPQRGLHFRQPPICSEGLMEPAESCGMLPSKDGIVTFAVVFVAPCPVPQIFVIGRDHAAFAARGQDLVLAKRESGHVSDRSHLLSFIGGAVSLRAVFNHA